MKILEKNEIEPKIVVNFFKEISAIPRKSGEEKEIREYLENFAKERNLEYEKDKYENIVIKKRINDSDVFLGLQAHTDMICEKNPDVQHDFSKDPITLFFEEDMIFANGTTLGADNGIGVAIILAVLDSVETAYNIEGIFTVQEETTMIGAIEIDRNMIKSRKIISLDNGKEGKVLVSSASCNEWAVEFQAKKEKCKYNEIYQLSYSNFLGGHSGGNIGEENRGNPIKLLAEAIETVEKFAIIDIFGGSRVNVIPRDANIIFAVDDSIELFNLKQLLEKQRQEYPMAQIVLEKVENNEIQKIQNNEEAKENKEDFFNVFEEQKNNLQYAFSTESSRKIIEILLEIKHGALQRDEKNNVILSSNLADIKIEEEKVIIEFSERANRKDLEKNLLKQISEFLEKNKLKIVWHQELKGVEKNPNSKLLNKTKDVYKKLYNKEMEEVVSQGVVEGGFFADKIENCEYICIGPNTYDVHSPKERLSISSLQRVWKFLKELLKNE